MPTQKSLRRRRAAQKAARTRAENRAMFKQFREVEEPAMRRMDGLLNYMLSLVTPIYLCWNPTRKVEHKLKNGAAYGTLVKFLNGGRILRVLPEGYRRPKDYHPAFWEPLYGKEPGHVIKANSAT